MNFSAFSLQFSNFYFGYPTILLIFALCLVLNLLYRSRKSKKLANTLLEKGYLYKQKRDMQLESIKLPPLDLTPEFIEEILRSDALKLLDYLKSGKITSLQLTSLYIQRAKTIGKDLELITEENFVEALDQAKKCDDLRKTNPQNCKGVLFGLPLSVKDNILLKGKETSYGVISQLGKNIPEEDGLLVKVLKSEGAIIFMKTNLCQLVLTDESGNNIYGRAQNPWNRSRTTGGSSGGESGSHAAGISPLGIGTDIGGSARIPASFCGVTGFKPTNDTICPEGFLISPEFMGILNVRLTLSPMGKTVDDINLLMKAILNTPFYDTLGPFEKNADHFKRRWNEEMVYNEGKIYTIGYYKSFPVFPSTLTAQRAVEEAVEILKKKGHTLVEVEMPNSEELALMWIQSVNAAGPKHVYLDNLQGEPPIPEFEPDVMRAKLPKWVVKLYSKFLKFTGESRMSKLLDNGLKISSHELLKLQKKQKDYQKDFFKFCEHHKLDALISPGNAHPASKHKLAGKIQLSFSYNSIFNMLNCPAGVIPVTLTKEGEDTYTKELCPTVDSIFKVEVQNMKGSVGLPMGVQVATLPFEDEKCLNIMRQIEQGAEFFKKHPLPIQL